MNKYRVEVTETAQKLVTIYSDTEESAIAKALELVETGDISLHDSNETYYNTDVEIYAKETQE